MSSNNLNGDQYCTYLLLTTGNITGNLIGKKSDNTGDENVITNATHDGYIILCCF